MSDIFTNVPVIAGAAALVVAVFLFGFSSLSKGDGNDSTANSKGGSKGSKGKVDLASSGKSVSAETAGGSKSKNKKNKNKNKSNGVAAPAAPVAPPAPVAAPAPAPAAAASVATEVEKSAAPSPAVTAAPAPELNGKASNKKDAAKEKKNMKKAEKKKAAAAAAAAAAAPATTSATTATETATTSAPSGGGASAAASTTATSPVETTFYSKESIDNFEDYEAAAALAAAAADSNDGWSTVEVSKKNRNKKSQSASSSAEELVGKVEAMSVVETPAPAPAPTLETAPTVVETAPEPAVPEPPREPSPPPVPQAERQVKVDAKKVGFIIGPKGATLRSIEDAAGCTIMVPKTDRESSAPATVTITGTSQAAAKGAKAISDLATKGYSALIAGEGFQENSILVPVKSLPDVIGRQGSTIKKIKDTFKVQLHIPDMSNRDATVTKVRVGIAGHKDQVFLAKNVLKEITQYFYSSVISPETTHEELEDIAEESYSLIIGPKGSEIRHIQNSFKVSVHIPNAESFVKKVLLVGKADSVEKAKAHIYKLISRAETRQQEYEQQYEARQQRIMEDEDTVDIPEDLQQYIYKREVVVITPPKPASPEPSSPFTNPGVVPAPESQETKNSWASIALSQGTGSSGM